MSALIAAGAAVAGTVANAVSTGKMNRKNRVHQSIENEKARQYNKEMWMLTNDYNDPKNQMARLRAAGINPHLAYSDGIPMNTSNGPGAASPSGTVPGQAPQFQLDTQGVISAFLAEKQGELIDSQVRKNNAEANNTETIAGINAVELQYRAEVINSGLSVQDMNIRVGDSTIRVNDQNIKESTQRVINLISSNEEIQGKIELLSSQKAFTDQQKANLVAQLGVMAAQIEAARAQAAASRASAENLRASAKYYHEKAKTESVIRSNVASQTSYNNEMVKGLKRQNQIGDKFDFTDRQNLSDSRFQEKDQAVVRTVLMQNQKRLQEIGIGMQEVEAIFQPVDKALNTAGSVLDVVNPFGETRSESSGWSEYGGDWYRSSRSRRR